MKRFKGGGERGPGIVAAFFAVLLLAGGCDSTHFQDGTGGAAGADGGGEPVNQQLDAGYPGDVSSLGARESWTGYLESYQFASGSDAISLSFATDPTGIVVGKVTLGAGSPPPPATDPEAIYPPGYTRFSGIAEGFPFTMAQGTLIGSRLRFTIWVTEVWSGWCALQTPIPGSPWCVPYGVYVTTSDDSQCYYQSAPNILVAVDSCVKIDLCTAPLCACTDGGCTANHSYSQSIGFDVSLSGTTGNGSLSQPNGVNIRLTKNP